MRTFFCFLSNLLLALISLAQAQSNVGIDPVSKRYTAQPGVPLTQTVNLWNSTASPQKIRVVAYLEDFDFTELGEVTYPKSGTHPRSAAKWISVTPSEVTLGSRERTQVRYTVKVPEGTPHGSYWAMLFFETNDGQPTPGQALAAFNVRVGHAAIIDVGRVTNEGKISGIFEKLPKNKDDYYELAVQYLNSGTGVSRVEGRAELRNEQGDTIGQLSFDRAVALPGQSTLLKAAMTGPLPKGRYTILVRLENGSKDREIVGEHLLELPIDMVLPARTATPSLPTTQTRNSP